MNKTLTTCIVCGSSDLNPLEGFKTVQLTRCRSCRMVFSPDVPSEDTLKTHYGNYPLFISVTETTKKRYNQILDKLEQYRQTNRLIDVGCGEGFFLEEAKRRGWEVYGTEYADLYIQIGERKGFQMQQGILDESRYEAGSFDVVTSFEVIEHLLTPVPEVRKFHTLLRAGGALYLTTPNFNSISRKTLGSRWSAICWPDHLSYYTPATLDFLLRNAGFQRKQLLTTGVSLERFRQTLTGSRHGEKKHETDEYRSLDHNLQEVLEKRTLLRWLKAIINRMLTFTSTGDAMKVLYEKTNGR